MVKIEELLEPSENVLKKGVASPSMEGRTTLSDQQASSLLPRCRFGATTEDICQDLFGEYQTGRE